MKLIYLGLSFLLFIILVVYYFSISPSNDRNWTVDQSVLAYADISGDVVNIHNVRNFSYSYVSEYSPSYYDKSYDLTKLDSLYFIVEPFSEWDGAAHTFLSFGFDNGDYVAVSIEIRKEIGEEFSAFRGIFKFYEIMYVWGDEQDLVKLRSNYRKDNVYVYPIRAEKEFIQSLFLDMLRRTNQLREKPEWYNTFTNTCTTNIKKHIDKIVPGKIPLSTSIFAPGFSDRFAFDLGIIDTSLLFEDAREYYRINDLAEEYADSSDFSLKIRKARR